MESKFGLVMMRARPMEFLLHLGNRSPKESFRAVRAARAYTQRCASCAGHEYSHHHIIVVGTLHSRKQPVLPNGLGSNLAYSAARIGT